MKPDLPDPDQGHSRAWPSTPYSDEARAPDPPWSEACSIALLGDCTVACSYLPPANRPENHLRVRLRRAFPGHPFRVANLSADGESARHFMQSGRMENVLSQLPACHIAFVRYGVNDRKEAGISGCIESLSNLCAEMSSRFPGVLLVLETGMWVDYPRHYLWDRNARLAPLYEAMKIMASRLSLPLLDIFDAMRRETEQGNWDLRVRGLPAPDKTVVDSSLDRFYGEDAAYFTNIHPNSTCLGLIATWQVALLTELLGERLPRP